MKDKNKKPTKGVRYIASVLKKYQEKKYPSNKEAMPEARKILAALKAKKGKDARVNIKNIWSESRQRRKPKTSDDKPFINEKLLIYMVCKYIYASYDKFMYYICIAYDIYI